MRSHTKILQSLKTLIDYRQLQPTHNNTKWHNGECLPLTRKKGEAQGQLTYNVFIGIMHSRHLLLRVTWVTALTNHAHTVSSYLILHTHPDTVTRRTRCFSSSTIQTDLSNPEESSQSLPNTPYISTSKNDRGAKAASFPPEAFLPKDFFRYELLYESKKSMARVGRIHTPHGVIDTPGFVAVATNGALKVCVEETFFIYVLHFTHAFIGSPLVSYVGFRYETCRRCGSTTCFLQ